MTAAPSGSTWRADLALALLTLIWGATFVVVKQALEDASTLLFLALRFSLAAGALAIAFRGRYASFFGPESFRPGVFAGLCLFTGYVFQTFGLRHTTASKSAFITGLSIVLVPLLSSLVYKKGPRLPEWLGVAVATTGLSLLTLQGESLRIGLGDSLTMVCAAAFAGHIVVVGHYARRVSVESLSLTQIGTAAGLSLATFWWAEAPRIRWSTRVVAALLITGLLATALAFTVQAWAQRRTTATRTALIFALEPVFAAVTSYLVAGEVLAARAVLGAVLILGGILLVELKPLGAGRHL